VLTCNGTVLQDSALTLKEDNKVASGDTVQYECCSSDDRAAVHSGTSTDENITGMQHNTIHKSERYINISASMR
jgi:hypothetical protein